MIIQKIENLRLAGLINQSQANYLSLAIVHLPERKGGLLALIASILLNQSSNGGGGGPSGNGETPISGPDFDVTYDPVFFDPAITDFSQYTYEPNSPTVRKLTITIPDANGYYVDFETLAPGSQRAYIQTNYGQSVFIQNSVHPIPNFPSPARIIVAGTTKEIYEPQFTIRPLPGATFPVKVTVHFTQYQGA